MNPDQKRSKAFIVCKWHDIIHRKPKRNYKKITGANQQIQKSCGIQGQYTVITCTPYTNNEKSEREIKESIPFTTETKRVKYLEINLPKEKEIKELYTENYKTLMKEMKDDINRWRDIPCPWVGRINVMKMIILPNAIYRLMWSLSNYQWHFSQN